MRKQQSSKKSLAASAKLGTNFSLLAQSVGIIKESWALISKRTKEVDINQINESIWKDYGNFLDKSTTTDSENKNSLNQYWQVDKGMYKI